MRKALLFALGLSLLCGCDSKSSASTTDTARVAAAPASAAKARATGPAQAAGEGPKKDYQPGMLDPSKAAEQAPDSFKAKFATTAGDFVIEVTREWSPNGADRFYNLVKIGYFDDVAFFRVVDDFMAQFGIHGDPDVARMWRAANIEDDEAGKQSNTRGMVTFAKTNKPNSRSTQLFISYKDNSRLDSMGFSPIGKVVEGMDVVDKLYNGYGEDTTDKQYLASLKGNKFWKVNYPKLDYIKTATLAK